MPSLHRLQKSYIKPATCVTGTKQLIVHSLISVQLVPLSQVEVAESPWRQAKKTLRRRSRQQLRSLFNLIEVIWFPEMSGSGRSRSSCRRSVQELVTITDVLFIRRQSGLSSGKRNWFLHNLTAKTPLWDLSLVLKTKHSFVFYYFLQNKCIFYAHIRTPCEMKASWCAIRREIFQELWFHLRNILLFYTAWNKECLIPFDRPCLIFYSKEGFVNIIIKCALWI